MNSGNLVQLPEQFLAKLNQIHEDIDQRHLKHWQAWGINDLLKKPPQCLEQRKVSSWQV